MEGQSPTTGPMVEINRPKAPHDFTRFNTLMTNLQDWRNADHDDHISVHRNQAIEIIEGVKALRAALDEIAAMDPKGIRADDLGRDQAGSNAAPMAVGSGNWGCEYGPYRTKVGACWARWWLCD